MAIVSNHFGFVFIKLIKTGSSSIEHDIAPLLQPGDICTQYPGLRPDVQNHIICKKAVEDGLSNRHASLKEIHAIVPNALTFCKICVVREPVDWCISHFAHIVTASDLREKHSVYSWDDYMRRGVFPVPDNNISLQGRNLDIDFFIRFEQLAEDCHKIFNQKLGLSSFSLRAKLRSGNRLASGIPTIYGISTKDRNIIYERFNNHLAALRARNIDYSTLIR